MCFHTSSTQQEIVRDAFSPTGNTPPGLGNWWCLNSLQDEDSSVVYDHFVLISILHCIWTYTQYYGKRGKQYTSKQKTVWSSYTHCAISSTPTHLLWILCTVTCSIQHISSIGFSENLYWRPGRTMSGSYLDQQIEKFVSTHAARPFHVSGSSGRECMCEYRFSRKTRTKSKLFSRSSFWEEFPVWSEQKSVNALM